MKITVKQMLLELALDLDARRGCPDTFVANVRTYHNLSVYTGGRYTDEGDTALLRRLYNEGCTWSNEVALLRGPRW
jgi:hypothetical protein